MRKYWAIVKTGFKNSLVYRADFFLWGFNEFLDTLIFLFIWMVVFGEKQAIGGFTLNETITYLIGVGLIANIVSSWMIYDIERDVQSGYLSVLLIKPVKYPYARFIFSLSGKPINLLIRIIVYFLVAVFFKHKLTLNTDYWQLFLVLVSVGLAYLINYLIDFLSGCISFWTITTRGFAGTIRTINSIFSGSYAPITFFPPLFQTFARFLPFIYTRYFPMLIYLGKVSTIEAVRGIGIQIFWVVILYFLAKIVWRRGVKRYEGVGI